MRSGTEIYGRAHGAPTRPDESADVDPTCDYGDMLAGIERTATAIGRRVGVTVGAIRMGTVLGPHVPSPLGRVLRMPAVPVQRARRPAVRRRRGHRGRQGVRRRRPAPPRRAGERRRQRRHHRPAGGPPRPPHPRPARRPGLAHRPLDQRPARRADPRPRHRDAAPRPPRRQLADGRAARLHAGRRRRWTSSTSCTSGRPSCASRPGRRWRDDATPTYEARVITLPVERTLTAARQRGGRRRRPARWPASAPWHVDDWGRDPTLVDADDPARPAALEHGRRRRGPAAGPRRCADRRQRPPLRPGAGLHGPRPDRARPAGRCASSAVPTSLRSGRWPAASAACWPGPTRSPAPCAPASCS